MTMLRPRLAGAPASVHPAVLSRRMRDRLLLGFVGAVVITVALAITIAEPKPNLTLMVALSAATLGILALLMISRYEVTVTLVILYLGLLDGPVKLLSASQAASAARDVLIFAVVLGMLARMSPGEEGVKMPPLSAWVFAFAAAVIIQTVNPQTGSILKMLGGFRQQLEWIPFFFFAYLILRSKEHFRKLFLILGVIALANGAVGFYQSRISPTALAAWGPGYNTRILGTGGTSTRTYNVEGEPHVRPPALGSDSGQGGGAGILAIPGLIALLSVGHLRRRWIALVLLAGAVLGVATAASRTSVVILVVELIAYAGLSLIGRLPVGRPLAALLAVIAVAVGVGSVLTAIEGPGVFKRQETVTSVSSAETSGADAKVNHLSQLPRILTGAPLGSGLGTGASAGGFGGKQKIEIEGQGASGENAYSLVALEVGLAGLLLWVGLTITVILLALFRLRSIADIELRTYLVAAFAVYVAFTAQGFAGPTLAVSPAGVYLWSAVGIAAYWLAGPGRRSPAAAGRAEKRPRPLLAAGAT